MVRILKQKVVCRTNRTRENAICALRRESGGLIA
jgi:hypothetical protein